MKDLILNFTTQLHEALIIGRNYKFKAEAKDFNNIVLTGLGGSGIGGSIVQNFGFNKLSIPFIVNKDYSLPSFINSKSLVIVSSYSGNTEETIAAMQQAIRARATIVCITSGGKIREMADKKKIDCILLPAGMPPRSCIGFSMTQVLFTLLHFGHIKNDFIKHITASIRLLNTEEKDIQKKAKNIAGKLFGKTPVIYSAADYDGLGVRVKQQLNENSKVLALQSVVPEMNHNELVGWKDEEPAKVVLMLRNEDDFERVQMRMNINKKVMRKYADIIEVYSKGRSYWERIFYFIHLTDWVSVMLADLRGQDATEVKVIDYLKKELAKV